VYERKAVRRRRAALAVFVALSIVILTAYFGESGGGFFHTLQRGAQEAFAPIETGASRALKPVRDFFGWAGDTIDAKDQNEDLKEQVDRLRAELADAQTARRDARQLKGLVGLHREEGFPRGTRPVSARVIARSPTVWYSSLKIDKGSSDGVRLNQPVIAAASNQSAAGNPVGGLAGKITRVTGGTAEVTLITDESSGVAAQVMPAGASGVVKPEVGNPRDLLLDFVEAGRRVTEGTIVVTSGFKASRVESLFPRGIPIGEVSKVDLDEVELYQRVHIRPFADLRRIDIVQVLTRKPPATQTAGVVTP
jgi:rod shape-determining protein MreC